MKLKKVNLRYEMFSQLLEDCLYETIGHIRSSPNTCSTHTVEMLKKLDLNTANFLLDQAEFHEEFHPDNIKYYRKLITQK